MKLSHLALAILLLVCATRAHAEEPAAAPVDYARDIKPLLANYCVDCHGASEQESGLRMDTALLARQGGNRGTAIVPGESEKSLLYLTVTGLDPDVPRMPMDGDPLSEEEIQLIKRWIDEGAVGPDDEVAEKAEVRSSHWAFQPVRRPEQPTLAAAAPPEAIDAFVLARLEQEGITPSPEADRATLIRRVSLDLTGLLPTVGEVDAFLADERPDAWERLVDRLLASPHYGERWGRHWLDLARYADSHGFTIDGPRSIWKYRDWVIDAFNRDLPFDQFTIEQLAGDLLPGATREQIIATGFHRNTLTNQEGGTDQEQFRFEAVVDRVDTTGQVFLGLTLGCAQCHDHKYDPISQRDFYQFFAVLNQCDEPTLPVPTPEQEQQLQAARQETSAAEKLLREHDAELAKGLPEWEQQFANVRESAWNILEPVELVSEGGATFTTLDDKSLLVGGTVPQSDTFTMTFDAPAEPVTAIRLELLTHESLPWQGPGWANNGNFVLSEFEISVGDAPEPAKIALALADWSQESYPVAHAIDGNLKTGWAISVGEGSLNVNRQAVFIAAEPISAPEGTRMTIRLRQNHSSKYLLGRFRLSGANAPKEWLSLPFDVQEIVDVPADQRTKEQADRLLTVFRETDEARKPLLAAVNECKAREKKISDTIPTTLVMKARSALRETHIHVRGDFTRKGAPVTAAVPAVLNDLPEDVSEATRLDVARWLVDPSNPLTARVTVNRVWQRFFGRGLVDTENDFGTQGSPPSHPELLDFLATEFMRQEWSMKRLHRMIVTSATYRQSSEFRAELAERDPQNALLARQSRLRLDAEVVRDVALAASGRLSTKIGGPGVHPPQPAGIYVLTQSPKPWPDEKGEDRYRRGMYTQFWRSSPYPFLMTFDAPNANSACTRRSRSNTPLQALTLANDLAFFELAQGMAERILREGPAEDLHRLRFAFRCGLAREPADAEQYRLTEYLTAQRRHFESAADEAAKVAPLNVPEGTTPSEGAAWVAVARVLMNLDEFITRE